MAIEALPNVVAAPSRPEGTPADVGGGQAQGNAFAQLLAQPRPSEARLEAGGTSGVGEQLSAGLQRFGQTIGKMEQIGAYKQHGAQAGQAPTSAAAQPTVLPGPAEQNLGAARRAQTGQDHISQAMGMAHDALGQQAQLYKVMMDFTLVHSSAESLNKSLKALLTQGGG